MEIKKYKRKLTLKQQRFTDEYLKTGNATEAASRVYKTKNRNTANAIWNENLVKPGIKAEIEDRVQEAKDIIYWLAKWSKKDEVKIRAAQDIIDRAEWKALARTQHSWEILILSEDELTD